jgi:hypothetical protein
MPGRLWTQEDVETLRTAVEEGANYAECAEELGRTPRAVQLKAMELGIHALPGRRPHVDYRLLLVSLVGKGLNCSAIAKRVGRHHTSVINMIRKLCREGILERTGGATKKCRYRVSLNWRLGGTKAMTNPDTVMPGWLDSV